MSIRETVIQAFEQRFGKAPRFLAVAPGRVNILGEHVDYNDGFVLPAAIDRATVVAFSPADAGVHYLVALDFGQETKFDASGIQKKTALDGTSLPGWALYPAGIAWVLHKSGLPAPAMQAVFASDVPTGAGLSSSASVEMAFASAWSALGGWQLPPMDRALLGQKAENQYVGVQCGIMDQFASACGVANHLLLLDCRSLDWQPLPLPREMAIVIADTTVRRQLTTSGYNERRQSCEEAVWLLRRDLPGIRSLRDVALEDFNRLGGRLPPLVEKRARHVVEEIARTQAALALLQAGEYTRFGELVNQCHASLRDLYEVSIPQLDIMVEIAQQQPGCLGARLTGAGFGGCTANLVEMATAQDFVAELSARYQERTGLQPKIYVCQASDGAAIVD